MRIAYCILCHKYNKILQTCVDILQSDNSVIYIHVDKKSNIKDFEPLKEKVKFLENRVAVYWGHISQVEATLELLKETKKEKVDYIFFISGDDLPLKNSKEIEEFLIKNNGKEFITVNECSKEIVNRRLKRIFSLAEINRNKNFKDKIKSKILRNIKKILKKQNPYMLKLPKIFIGDQWFTITDKFRDYIFEFLKEKPYYFEGFKYSKCGDELFFQTLIMDSPFKEDIYKINYRQGNLRYIDWFTGPEYPRVLNEEDYKKILETECVFGRKFDDKLNLEEFKNIFIEEKRRRDE